MTRILFNGVEYHDEWAMPPDVHEIYKQALGQSPDSDHDGIPDLLEQKENVEIVINTSSVGVTTTTNQLPPDELQKTAPPPAHQNAILPVPPELNVQDTPSLLIITVRSQRGLTLFNLAFPALWLILVINQLRSMLVQTVNGQTIFFGVVFLGIGLASFIPALIALINHTTIRVTPQSLQITNDPIPFGRNWNLKAPDLAQLFTEPVTFGTRSGSSVLYNLCAVSRSNQTLRLMTNLPSRDAALFIEKRAERVMGIPDQTVVGEVGTINQF